LLVKAPHGCDANETDPFGNASDLAEQSTEADGNGIPAPGPVTLAGVLAGTGILWAGRRRA
jgi:hypothetical protein